MRKILFLFICIIYGLFTITSSFSSSIPVENIFSDVDKSYKYYDELQVLYDRGMIFPDKNGRFNPNKLLNRDEFVGISQEITCKRCISPNTEINFIKKYSGTEPFFDVPETNKYFYCIADADANNFVAGYDKNYTCEDGTSKTSERPFCVNNKITLEEALAVILRNSGIFTISDNKKVFDKIYSGEKLPDLSADVSAKNLDGSPYTFYGYLQKALSYELLEYDKDGNEKNYKLLELKDNKIRPKQSITKQEFLRIAYITLKANSCLKVEDDNLALNIDILDKVCKETDNFCSKSNLKDPTNTYDFKPIVGGACVKGIKNPEGYIWRFYNLGNGKQIKKYGKYVDNYSFLSDGNWRVYLRVIDNCGNAGEIYSNLNILGDDLFNVDILANPIIGKGPLRVDFGGLVQGGGGDYSYEWDFGDSKSGYGKIIDHIFTKLGVYKVKLVVNDGAGNSGETTVLIKVLPGRACEKDNDGDRINDCDDKCPLVVGEAKNYGCPVFGDFVKPAFSGCSYDIKNTFIYGNAIVNSCPSSNFLDFNSDLRKCDLVFPAITSPDSKDIYSKGEVWEIK